MFIKNNRGRIVGLPENMEEAGFKQAREVLSISSSLMQGGQYIQKFGRGSVQSKGGRNLRDKIIAKFPDVVTDEEFLEINDIYGVKKQVEKPVPEEKKTESIVNEEMTKNMIIDTAKEYGVQLSTQEKRLTKAKLMALIDERHNR